MEPVLSQMIERVRAAAAGGTPLRIRGGGSKDFYGEPVAGDLLETTAHAGVTSYEPSELVVTVRAGTPLAELESLLAGQGQCLPFEPPHFAGGATSPQPLGAGATYRGSAVGSVATVGGMVATALAGPARASVGGVRDYVLGLSMINGRGELLTFGGQVMKNVAGYDVSRLVTGSLGTLGVIVEVSLKVLPKAPAEATLKFEMTQAQALRSLNEWGGKPLPLNASCWVGGRGQRHSLPSLARCYRGRGGRLQGSRWRTPGQRASGGRLAGLPRPAPAVVRRTRRARFVAAVGAADHAGARPAGSAAGRMAWRPALAARRAGPQRAAA
jgi:glycolate oxidase FAD binding subunit